MLVAVACVLALAAAPVPPDNSDNAKALKALQGRWKLVAGEERGEAGRADDFGTQDIVVKDVTLTRLEKGKERDRFTIKFDLSKFPAHLDLVEQGKTNPGTCHAIYKCEGDRLTICFAGRLSPSEAELRPTEFKTGPSDQRPPKGKLMYTFERVKDKD